MLKEFGLKVSLPLNTRLGYEMTVNADGLEDSIEEIPSYNIASVTIDGTTGEEIVSWKNFFVEKFQEHLVDNLSSSPMK